MRAGTKSLRKALLALLVLAAAGAARAEEPRCQRWNVEVTCSTSVPSLILGDEFAATVVVRNTGDTALANVTLRLKGDQGAPCTSGPAAGVFLVVDKLEPGASKELTARFAPETVGTARVMGSARDSLGWASGNAACTVEVIGLPAIHAEMRDEDLTGKAAGMFPVGAEFQYGIEIRNEGGTAPTPDLKVLVTLPKELEFTGGGSAGAVKVEGSGQSATAGPFSLAPPDGKVRFAVRVKAVAAPTTPGRLVKVTISVQNAAGTELASESESTTIR